ncbi:hypothetical protein [Mucilaginibacter sp.]|uniref:hypothetical protein n=1 Tax=Mucilaginibacter sp. TaxID=1882438 RepID=UPI002ED681B1
MKRNLFYLLPLLLTLGVACSPKNEVVPVAQPQGNFTGTFGALVKKASGAGYDTIRDTISLKLTATGSLFKVAANTRKHVASYGAFAYNGYYIQFNDSLAVVPGVNKFHLSKVYQYYYDGNVLQMQRNTNGDTLTVQYNLKKTN